MKGTVTAAIDGTPAQVLFAGLLPGLAGVYQVNLRVPFTTTFGQATLTISVGSTVSQGSITIPHRPLGFYYAIFGSKPVPGQGLTGLSGSGSALAIRQSDSFVWGNAGFNSWTNSTGLNDPAYSVVVGLAVTLKNGSSIVYDNNGLETNTYGNFYNNVGGPADTSKPGLSKAFSMSNYFPLVFATSLHLTQSTTITQMIGYFDQYGDADLPFNPANPYVRFRMNIWSDSAGPLPKETANYVGDVFSSDTSSGTFAYSATGASRVSSTVSTPSPINRITYTLSTPLTLPAGDYWFSHDVGIRSTPASSSTAQSIHGDESVLMQWHGVKAGRPVSMPVNHIAR